KLVVNIKGYPSPTTSEVYYPIILFKSIRLKKPIQGFVGSSFITIIKTIAIPFPQTNCSNPQLAIVLFSTHNNNLLNRYRDKLEFLVQVSYLPCKKFDEVRPKT